GIRDFHVTGVQTCALPIYLFHKGVCKMSFFKEVNRPFILFFALTISIPSWAMPIMFEFTGTVSDSVLISGRYQTIYTNVPEWSRSEESRVCKESRSRSRME